MSQPKPIKVEIADPGLRELLNDAKARIKFYNQMGSPDFEDEEVMRRIDKALGVIDKKEPTYTCSGCGAKFKESDRHIQEDLDCYCGGTISKDGPKKRIIKEDRSFEL